VSRALPGPLAGRKESTPDPVFCAAVKSHQIVPDLVVADGTRDRRGFSVDMLYGCRIAGALCEGFCRWPSKIQRSTAESLRSSPNTEKRRRSEPRLQWRLPTGGFGAASVLRGPPISSRTWTGRRRPGENAAAEREDVRVSPRRRGGGDAASPCGLPPDHFDEWCPAGRPSCAGTGAPSRPSVAQLSSEGDHVSVFRSPPSGDEAADLGRRPHRGDNHRSGAGRRSEALRKSAKNVLPLGHRGHQWLILRLGSRQARRVQRSKVSFSLLA